MKIEYWNKDKFVGTGTTYEKDTDVFQTLANEIFYTTDFEFDSSITIWFY